MYLFAGPAYINPVARHHHIPWMHECTPDAPWH